jgi:hypothetical protein
MFLHSGETSAIVARTLAKEPIMEKSRRPKAKPENLAEMNRLSRIMEGNESKYRKQDMETLMDDPGVKKSPRPKARPGSMVKGYKNGGCVMSGRGGKYKGSM